MSLLVLIQSRLASDQFLKSFVLAQWFQLRGLLEETCHNLSLSNFEWVVLDSLAHRGLEEGLTTCRYLSRLVIDRLLLSQALMRLLDLITL